MNKLYCLFCDKELEIKPELHNYYQFNLYCCKREYTIENLRPPMLTITKILCGLFYYKNIQYYITYYPEEDRTYFRKNNIKDADKPNYNFAGLVDQQTFERLMKLKAFW